VTPVAGLPHLMFKQNEKADHLGLFVFLSICFREGA